MHPRHSFVPLLGHELHVTEWGDPAGKPLVMWHGLARTGRDFDELAVSLGRDHFVICPDTIGRGLSSWSKEPATEYNIETYAKLAIALLDHYEIAQTGWLGTSMGGLIGMRLASGGDADRLSYLIINDIGPEIPQEAIDRILEYAGSSPEFKTLAEAEAWFKAAYKPFGPASDAFWNRMVRSSVRRLSNGAFTTHYDPKIIMQFQTSPDELETWDKFSTIQIPMHVVQGRDSDLLPRTILDRMKQEQPEMGATVINPCGHAPTLSRPEDCEMVAEIIGALSVN